MDRYNKIEDLVSIIRTLPEYKTLLDRIMKKSGPASLGLSRASRLSVISALCKDLQIPVLLVTDKPDRTLSLIAELCYWAPNIKTLIFPEPSSMFYEMVRWGMKTRNDRLKALASLAAYHVPGNNKEQTLICIAPIRAVMTRTLPRHEFLKVCHTIRLSDEATPESLQQKWFDIGYESVDTVLEPGQYSRRGGILDVWTPEESHPVRLEFFGDEIDTLRRFDPATQRTVEKIEQIIITPAKEILPGKAFNIGIPIQDLMEFHIPLSHNVSASILDYLPKKSLLLLDDIDLLESTAIEIEEQAANFREDSIEEGVITSNFPYPYLSWSEIMDNVSGKLWIELGGNGTDKPDNLADCFLPGKRFAGQLKHYVDYLVESSREKQNIVVISRQSSRLQALLSERQSTSARLSTPPLFLEGTLSEGWLLRSQEKDLLQLHTDSEIFGWERPKPRRIRRPVAEAPESSYADLVPGDWVVHVDFGVGKFIGLIQRTIDDIEREYLCIEYAEGDQLFVPVYQADLLSKYIGTSSRDPAPTRLGTIEWSNAKQKVRESVQQLAEELLEVYAKRRVAKGFAYQPDTAWQHELESSFPYIETEDQIRAIIEVKDDMESLRPMDRLLCGDVGYGKTEVALRAAFKAVIDGRQVAMLVPTTVLAQQHFDTFRQRLSAFPVSVEMLSRFRTSKEQDEIIKRLSAASIDIIIGTHRLLQPDIQFKNLGLLIIDEEQRFGVAHKEYFKRMRTELDVLTLTATPIPRTLYMALTGVRDISTINTPPEERLPIETHIGPFSSRLIKHAIIREVERGGQVFFVHNRVQSIIAMKCFLNRLVPGVKIGIAHGQMPEIELAKVMADFTQGRLDILLCTSIIESGLDIPNANTLIVDRGDAFGLSQLYQLRGRVGRGAHRAYAYFFRHPKKRPTPEGLERLEIISENMQLGSGYSIAMRDLEMRGAGELLGTQQHGFITSVGFHLYTRLLAQAVREIQKNEGLIDNSIIEYKRNENMPVNVELPLSIGIPLSYIPKQELRLKLYRRLADVENEDSLQVLFEELDDRFGNPPQMVRNLFYQMKVKLRAEKAGIVSVANEADQIVLRYPPLPDGVSHRNLIEIGNQTRTGKNAYWILLENKQEEKKWKTRLLEVLSAIIDKNLSIN